MTRLEAARASQQARTEQGVIKNHNNIRKGWTAVYDRVGHCPALSDGAFRTYFNLCTYDYGSGSVFPGEVKLAEIQGVTPRTIRSNIKELVAAGLVTVNQRGLGLTNLYELPDAENWTPDALAEWKKTSGQRSGKILPIKGGNELPVQSEENCRSSRKRTSAKEEEVPNQTKSKANKGKAVGAGKPRRTTVSLKSLSTEDDETASDARRLALGFCKRVFGWQTINPKNLTRYESYFAEALAQGKSVLDCKRFTRYVASNGYWTKDNAQTFNDAQFAKEWDAWEGAGEPEEKAKRQRDKTPAHVQRERSYARPVVAYEDAPTKACCDAPACVDWHAYDCPSRADEAQLAGVTA